jgi:small redox-active disulfide protein 2
MTIQVLGSGCPTCRRLYEITQKAVAEMQLSDSVEYITDITKIIELGLMQSPVLVINGKPVLAGYTNDTNKIKELISREDRPTSATQECCAKQEAL